MKNIGVDIVCPYCGGYVDDTVDCDRFIENDFMSFPSECDECGKPIIILAMIDTKAFKDRGRLKLILRNVSKLAED